MEKLPKQFEPISREVVVRVANIIGDSSAAGHALTELDRRLALGENAAVFWSGSGFIVGPAPAETKTIAAH